MAQLLDAGLEEIVHRKRLVLDAQLLARDTPHARRRNLGLRHPHHVFIRHAYGELARDFLEQPAWCAACGVGVDQSTQPVEIEPVSYTHLRAHETVLDLV